MYSSTHNTCSIILHPHLNHHKTVSHTCTISHYGIFWCTCCRNDFSSLINVQVTSYAWTKFMSLSKPWLCCPLGPVNYAILLMHLSMWIPPPPADSDRVWFLKNFHPPWTFTFTIPYLKICISNNKTTVVNITKYCCCPDSPLSSALARILWITWLAGPLVFTLTDALEFSRL